MKKSHILVVFSLVLCAITLCGCGSKELDSAEIELVSGLKGGGVEIEYNRDLREIYVGGEGELIPYFEEDILNGIEYTGNYIGLKFTAPEGVDELETGVLGYNGKTVSAGRFYRTVNGQKTREFVVYFKLSEEKPKSEIKVTWQDGSKEQIYKVIVLPKTQFEK